ncbi:IclR family transcriptional regulator [Angustibacter sp. McL0619]|uniref:IclR family transcriptional regulator n=1 Tax=Angustibacter sp. McL0619 TaxID=3415676 RepID=UPI003CF9E341
MARSIAVLQVFNESNRTLKLVQVARRAGLPMPTAHRLVGELTEANLLVRRRDGSYEIGEGAWRLSLLSTTTRMRETVLPHLHDVAIATGHAVHFAVLDGPGALVVERLRSPRVGATPHRPGTLLPLHCTAVGKALLAFADPELRRSVLSSLSPFTEFTITDPALLQRQLDVIRETAVARTLQEHLLGLWSIAVPVQSHDGVNGAIAVVAPAVAPRTMDVIAPLRSAAAAMSTSLRRIRDDMHAPSASRRRGRRR